MFPPVLQPGLMRTPTITSREDGRRDFHWKFRYASLLGEFLNYLEQEGVVVTPRVGVDCGLIAVSFTYEETQALPIVFCCYLVGRLHSSQHHLNRCLEA